MGDVARIDKWLWAARIFKTRSIAADACKNGRVTINGVNVKPSHTVKAGETVAENVTTPDQYELLEMNRISGFVNRARGTGRPTKKDRRQMDAFVGPSLEGDFDTFFGDDWDEEDED